MELLIWTTTPWTLVSNTAIAVNPEVTYAIVRRSDGIFVVAEPLVSAVLGAEVEMLTTIEGNDLLGLHYTPPFDLVAMDGA